MVVLDRLEAQQGHMLPGVPSDRRLEMALLVVGIALRVASPGEVISLLLVPARHQVDDRTILDGSLPVAECRYPLSCHHREVIGVGRVEQTVEIEEIRAARRQAEGVSREIVEGPVAHRLLVALVLEHHSDDAVETGGGTGPCRAGASWRRGKIPGTGTDGRLDGRGSTAAVEQEHAGAEGQALPDWATRARSHRHARSPLSESAPPAADPSLEVPGASPQPRS